jgi:hypothetical protein
MSHAFDKCPNCGAPLEQEASGRAVHCPFCGGGGSRAVDPVALAQSLQGDARSVQDLYENIARRLSEQFPGRTLVRRSGGLLSKKRVEELELTLDDSVFRMKRKGDGVHAERLEIVGGITVKTQHLSVDAWVQALSEALSALATSSAEAREALKRLRG